MQSIDSFPTTAGLHDALRHLAGVTAYVVPMTDDRGEALGNNGDQLMHRVFDRLLEELSIARTSDIARADAVIVPPSGALLETYSFPALLQERLRGTASLPLIVFPSSLYFPTKDPSVIFANRTAPTLLLLREERSLMHLNELWGQQLKDVGVTMVLDHDVVASGHSYVPGIIDTPSRKDYLLVAARRDKESSATALALRGTPSTGARLRQTAVDVIPYGRSRTWVARTARRSANRRSAISLLAEVHGGSSERSGRVVMTDVSATQFATFDEYRRAIARADEVVTNRLHVGLPAAILGKKVVLVEGGYHKLSGVYERSLRDVVNVSLAIAGR